MNQCWPILIWLEWSNIGDIWMKLSFDDTFIGGFIMTLMIKMRNSGTSWSTEVLCLPHRTPHCHLVCSSVTMESRCSSHWRRRRWLHFMPKYWTLHTLTLTSLITTFLATGRTWVYKSLLYVLLVNRILMVSKYQWTVKDISCRWTRIYTQKCIETRSECYSASIEKNSLSIYSKIEYVRSCVDHSDNIAVAVYQLIKYV